MLDSPFSRGEEFIQCITVTKPNAGALRGVTLTDLLQFDVVALTKVLPRISQPTLTEADVTRMDPADLVQLGTEVAAFLVPKHSKVDPFPDASMT
jgi:hypothetical protein